MSNQNDFEIVRGELVKYRGPGGDVVIPDSVTDIGRMAFEGCIGLRSVTLPAGLHSVGISAFRGCKNLSTVTILAEKVEYYGFMYERPHPFEGCSELCIPSEYLQKSGKVPEAFIDTINTMSLEDYAWLCLNQGAKEWRNALDQVLTEENTNTVFSLMTDLIESMTKVTNTIGGRAADFVIMRHAFLDRAEMERMCVQLEKKCKQAGARLRNDPCMAEQTETNPLQKEYDLLLQKESGEKLLKDLHLDGYPYPEIEMENGGSAPTYLFKYILVSYMKEAKKRNYWNSYQAMWGIVPEDMTPPSAFLPEADRAAALLNREKLCTALDELVEKCPLPEYPSLLYPYCRYAAGKRISAVAAIVNKAQKGSGKDRRFAEDALRALQLSDTREAMLILDKNSMLEEYASLRGLDADLLRDTVLSEVGLDELGRKVYDLGTGTVTASLRADLSLELFDDNAHKIVRSIPKKNAIPENYEAAKVDFDELKKNVKNVAKNRSDRLFEAFLDGRVFPAADWKTSYFKNPVLNKVARLIVWAQGENTFTLSESGAITGAEQPYTITEEPIRVAHPIEIDAEDIQAWQNYYNVHAMKQPFQQIWEPVHSAGEIAADRYTGILLPLVFFKNAEKHGLKYQYLDSVDIELQDCEARYNVAGERRHELDPDAAVEITDFRIPSYTRQANHIVALLDRWTARERIAKDDLAVMGLMPGFTLAQITEFIAAAQEANATNVLAALLEYKNANFADFDPMDEFTLEW